jgi:hypothetical protein
MALSCRFPNISSGGDFHFCRLYGISNHGRKFKLDGREYVVGCLCNRRYQLLALS